MSKDEKSGPSVGRRDLVIATAVTALATALPTGFVLAQDKPTVLITGSNRGIGLALAQAYAAKGWRVIATCRKPNKAAELKELAEGNADVVIEALDVTDHRQIEALAKKYRDQPIDVLLNNAGILGGNENQIFGDYDFEAFDLIMDVNTKGPLKMAEAFIDHVAKSQQKKIVNVSSAVSSITLTFGGQGFYRASKAALNMSMRTLSKELRRAEDPAHREVIIALISPGVVDTEFAKNVPIPMISAEDSAAGLVEMIDLWDMSLTGDLYEIGNKKIPW